MTGRDVTRHIIKPFIFKPKPSNTTRVSLMNLVHPFARIVSIMMFCATAVAEDWPSWMGAQRDNVWRESGILEKFPEGGPEILWRTPVAGGYSGPAVAGGRVYVTDYVTSDDVKVANFNRQTFTGTERVLCLDQVTGKVIWQHEYPVTYGISYPAGPRCTPIVNDGKVYTLGAEGDLYCFSEADGSIIWSKNFPTEYSTKTALWGYASHPLVDGDQLICIAGGEGSHVVSLDKNTGAERWRSLTSTEQGYSPPMIFEFGGVRQLIIFYPNALASIDPDSGKPFWSIDYQATNGSAIMTPLVAGDLIYAAGYSNKNLLARLTADPIGAEVIWQDEVKTAISPVNAQPFLRDGVLYGFDQSGYLYAAELETGKRLWQSTEVFDGGRPGGTATAFMVNQGDRTWMFTELGDLVIAKLSPEGYTEIDRAHVIEPSNVAFGRRVVWSAPAWADKTVFLRNDDECIAVKLSGN